MPDSWANWGETWQELTATYGITHADTDMSSAEELNMFENEKDAPTKDIGDVGLAFTTEAIERGLVQGYKTSYWDAVPDWAKGENGLWMIAYTGVTTFLYNEDITDEPAPTSWADVRNGTYKITIGDVIGGATGQGNVLSTAYAFGGDMDNLDPAFEFWAEMAKAGRIDQGDILLQRIQAGEVQLGVTWSYNALGYRDQTPNYTFTVGVPSDGSILSGYASVINSYAPHPFAAALAREYIFSDEGQNQSRQRWRSPHPDGYFNSAGNPGCHHPAVRVCKFCSDHGCCKICSSWRRNLQALGGRDHSPDERVTLAADSCKSMIESDGAYSANTPHF